MKFPIFAKPKNVPDLRELYRSNNIIVFVDEYNGWWLDGESNVANLSIRHGKYKSEYSVFHYEEENGKKYYSYDIIDINDPREYIYIEMALHDIFETYQNIMKLKPVLKELGHDISKKFVYKEY